MLLFYQNRFRKLNERSECKCHLLTFGINQVGIEIKTSGAICKERSKKKSPRVIIDKNLDCKSHVSTFCKRTSQKLRGIAMLSPFIDCGKLLLLMSSFVKS